MLGPRGLLNNSARVLVTHASHVLGAVDRLHLLHAGRFGFSGTYTELAEHVASGQVKLDDAELPGLSPGAGEEQDDVNALAASRFAGTGAGAGAGAGTAAGAGVGAVSVAFKSTLQSSMKSLVAVHQEHSTTDMSKPLTDGSSPGKALGTADAKNLMTKEDRAVGSVSWDAVRQYIRAFGGPWKVVLLFMCFMLERISYVGVDWWLSVWVSEGDSKTRDFGIGDRDDGCTCCRSRTLSRCLTFYFPVCRC